MALVMFAGLAWAQGGCADKPYTLETPQGIAGGGNLDYNGSLAVFTDGACLETKGLELQAPELHYDQASGVLQAQNMVVQTPRYRFWADQGTVQNKTLLAEGIRVTTCRCGEDLRIVAASMRFDTDTGEAVLEQSELQFRQIGLAQFQKLQVSPKQSLTDSFGLPTRGGASSDLVASLPVRADFDQGFNFGLQDFPIPSDGKFIPNARFTVLALQLGSPDPGVRFGGAASEGGRVFQAAFEAHAQSGLSSSSLVQDGPVLFTHDTTVGHYGFRLQNTWALDNFSLEAYGQIARDANLQIPTLGPQQGLAAGSELRYHYAAQNGPFSLDFAPFTGIAFYPQYPNYFVVGGSIEGRYNADFNLSLRYDWSVENRPSRFWLERHQATQRISGSFADQGLSTNLSRDLLNGETIGSVRYGWQQYFGEIWAQYNLCAGCGGKITRADGLPDIERQELVLGFNPNPLSCTDTISLSPNIGYDFLRQGISRAGLELRYADCCFIWKIGYQYIFLPQTPDEKTTGKFIFGLELR